MGKIDKTMKTLKALLSKPFAFKLHGKVIENDHVEVEDLEIGVFWIVLFLMIVIF